MAPARRGTSGIAALTLAAGLLALSPAGAAQAADAVDGALTSGDRVFPNQGNGGYDALHYDLDLDVDVAAPTAADAVAGTTITRAVTRMRARTTGAPLRSFALDLQGLTVSSVVVDNRPATFRRIDTTDVEDPTGDVHKLVITPEAPVEGTFTTVVRYSGTPVSHTDADGSSEGWNNTSDGATFVNQPVGAMTGFPHNDTPSDKATYTVDVDVPSTITNAAGPGPAAAASNGELVAQTPSADGSRTTWSWRQREQMASELLLISIGKYDVRTSDITLGDGRVIPEWSFLDSALSDADKALIDTRRAATPGIIRGLETLFGPYPGNSAGLVVDRVPGGISYALETQDRSFFPSARSVGGSTLIHELTHQWYGDAVSPVTWNDIWINEGMASWAPGHYNNRIAQTTATTTETAQFASWSQSDPTRYAVPPATFTDAAELYDFQTYTRSAQMWEALKGSIGDEAFFGFVAAWQSRYAGGSHGTADFVALAQEISGRDLQAFFADWLYDTDKPAWVQRWVPSLSADVATATPGTVVTYTLSAADVGKVPLDSSVGVLDLADVLDDATLDAATLPAGLSLSGTTLRWAVPPTAVGATSTVSFAVTVAPGADAESLVAVLGSETLGGICAEACTSTVAVPAAQVGTVTVTGAPAVGSALVATPAGWPAGTAFAYQWSVGRTPVPGATAATYVPTAADRREVVTVTVTATRPGLDPVAVTSAPTSRVLAGTQPGIEPSVRGALRVGSVLRVRPFATLTGSTTTYRWKVDSRTVQTSSRPRLRLRPGFARGRLTLITRVTRPGYVPVRVRTVLGQVAPR